MTFTPLQPGDEKGFREMVEIYQEAIERSEQKSVGEIARLLRDDRYEILVLRSDDIVVAFAILVFPAGADFWLLEYMAVSHPHRSRGLGECIFAAARSTAEERAPSLPCLLEVDQPYGLDASVRKAERRIDFYRRMGCRLVFGLNYILPLAVSGESLPPMSLLVHGLQHTHSVPRETVRRWLATLYDQVYRCAPDDRRIDLMLSHLPADVELRTL